MKPIWLSKTFWVNLLSAVAMVLESTDFTDAIPAEWQGYFTMALAVLNIILRMVTTKGVTLA